MKCEHCGANLQIEDAFCPYCGKENPYARQHREDMAHYENAFHSTRSEVMENSRRFNRYTVKITIIAVLVALCAIAAAMHMWSYEIGNWILERKTAANHDSHIETVYAMLDDSDYQAAHEYIRANEINYTNDMREYQYLFSVIDYYDMTMKQLLYVYNWEETEYAYSSLDDEISRLASLVGDMYDAAVPYAYADKEQFSADKTAYMQSAIEDMELMLNGYFQLSDEEAAALPDRTDMERSVLFKTHYEDMKGGRS